MPLFSDIAKNLKDIAEEDKAALIALGDKYPDLDSVVARKRDADEAIRRASQLEGELATAKATSDSWKAWSDKNWISDPSDPTKGWTKHEQDLRAELGTARARVAELAAMGASGGDMDFEAIKTQLKEAGYVQKDDIAGFAKKDDLTPIGERISAQANYFEHFYARTGHLYQRFTDDFHGALSTKYFPMGDFLRFTTTGDDATVKARLGDLDKAYEEFTGQFKQQMDLKAEQEKLVADRAALDKERAAVEALRTSGASVTDGSNGTTPPQGALDRRRAMITDPEYKDDGLSLGKGQIARQATEDFRKNGTLVPQQVVQ